MDINHTSDNFTSLDIDELLLLAQQEKWFHAMKLSTLTTHSWVYGNSLPPNYHLYPTIDILNNIDLEGLTCLDIGTFDGLLAFCMSLRGAKSVLATCRYNLKRFRIARSILGCQNLSYYHGIALVDFSHSFPARCCDLIVMTAMMHHVVSPISALMEARRLLKLGGLLVIETIYRHGDCGVFWLNTAIDDPVYGCPTIWIPSQDSLAEVLRLCCFSLVTEIQLISDNARETNYFRKTYLARAETRPSVGDRSEKLIELHSKIDKLESYDYSQLEDSANKLMIRINHLPPSISAIDIRKYVPIDPVCPDR